MLAAQDIVPHHVTGTEKQVGDGPLGVVVHERDGLAGAHIHPAFPLLLPFFLNLGLLPRDITQFIVYGPQAEPGT